MARGWGTCGAASWRESGEEEAVFGAVGGGGQEEKKTSSSVRGGLHLLRTPWKELHIKLCVIHSTAKSGVITPLPYENIHVKRKNFHVNQASLHLVIFSSYLHLIGVVKHIS
jgi:hypothetical protein